MSALNAPRNTREIFYGGTGFSRKLEIAAGYTLYPGAIAAIDREGKAVPAADAPHLITAGICEAVFNGCAYLRSGTFRLENGKGNEALTRQDIGRYVYALDDQTVGRIGGTNSLVAGVLMDFDEGQAVVTIGNHPASVPASAIVKKVEADPETAAKYPAGTILIVTASWSGGTNITEAAAGDVYLNNGTKWVKLG